MLPVIQRLTDFLRLQVKDLPAQMEKMDELSRLPGFKHDAKMIEETGQNRTLGKNRVFGQRTLKNIEYVQKK